MKNLFVKICGITTNEQIDWAVELGYNAIGIMRHEGSPRYCDVKKAEQLCSYGKGKIKTVAVGLTLKEIGPTSEFCDYIQVYEKVEGDNVILASSQRPVSNNFLYFLYDASQGSGEIEEFPQWLKEYSDRLIIAGGLNPDNVAGIIKKFPSIGVDVSSGVEIDRGIKDYSLMKVFIDEVRNAQ